MSQIRLLSALIYLDIFFIQPEFTSVLICVSPGRANLITDSLHETLRTSTAKYS
jgi:hypothetical protein